jgi:hypothetical protein
MEYMIRNGTANYGNGFYSEQINFSNADIQRMEFFGKEQESCQPIINVDKQIKKFQLIDGELFAAIDNQLPPNAEPLTEESGVFKLIGISDAK